MKNKPNMAKKVRAMPAAPAEKRRSENSSIGSMGWSLRLSQATNVSNRKEATTKDARMIPSDHPRSGAWMIP